MSEVIRECRSANHQGFETVKPDGGKRREDERIVGVPIGRSEEADAWVEAICEAAAS